jgi:hypothetical protein
MQPKGNLPMMKPDDMQYFDKLLVGIGMIIWIRSSLMVIPLAWSYELHLT